MQRLQLCLQIGFVLGSGVLEHLPLLGVHALRTGAELPCLQARQLKGDLLELGVLELDLAFMALRELLLLLELACLRRQFGEHAGGEPGHRRRIHRLQRLGVERLEVHHSRTDCAQPLRQHASGHVPIARQVAAFG